MQQGLETKAMCPLGVAPTFSRPPVAQIAAESAAEAALREVAGELADLRAEGRVVLRLPLAAIQDDWLIRDRIGADPEELAALRESLRSHGQRTPIEVAEVSTGRFGLISGWRRLLALRELAAEDPGFDTVLALLRRPETSANAYVAMVEENEIRAGLSYWERARVAARAVDGGVFPTEKAALQQLFATASRAKRSKIGSFLALVRALDGALRFPAALPERAGLALAQRLAADPGFADPLRAALAAADISTPEAEQSLVRDLIAGPRPPATVPERETMAPGIWLETAAGRLVVGGRAVDAGLRARLAEWLRAQG